MKNELNIQEKPLIKIAFYILGIGGMGAWNAILSQLVFFDSIYTEYQPDFLFPLLNFILNVIFQFYLVFRGNPFTYKKQIIVSLFVSISVLILLPIISHLVKGTTSFAITIVLMIIQGFANAVILSGLFGITAYLPPKYMVAFSSGQGISGILMNVIGFILYFIIKGTDEYSLFKEALIYFIIAAIIISISIVMIIMVYKNRFFIYCHRNSGEFQKDFLEVNNIFEETNEELDELIEAQPSVKAGSKDFFELLKQIPELCIGIVVVYIGTFLVFPGACFDGVLVSNPVLNNLIILILFNTCDTIGRFSANFLLISRVKTVILAFLRSIPITLLILIANADNDHLSVKINKYLVFFK